MSNKLVRFGVPKATPNETITQACAGVIDILDSAPEDLFVWIQRPSLDPSHRLRWFSFYGRQGRHYLISPFVESLTERLTELVVVVHNDQVGAFLFEYRREGSRPISILSDGPLLAPLRYSAPITVDYPQRAFTHAQLDAICERAEADLRPAERAAVTEYHNAVTVGLRQCFPDEGRSYLSATDAIDLFQIRAGHQTLKAARPISGEIGDSVLEVVPDDSHWRAAGIPNRFDGTPPSPLGSPPPAGALGITDTTYPEARRKARAQLGGGVIALGIVGVGLFAVTLVAGIIYRDELRKMHQCCDYRDFGKDPYYKSRDSCYEICGSGRNSFLGLAVGAGVLAVSLSGAAVRIFRREPRFMTVLRKRPGDVREISIQAVDLTSGTSGMVLRTTYVVCIRLVDGSVLPLDFGTSRDAAEAEVRLVAARAPKATVAA